MTVRAATSEDADAMAACQVACWRETYAHLVSAALLAGFDVPAQAERWRGRLDGAVVAVVGSEVVGLARPCPSRDEPPVRPVELAVLYLRAVHHGSGLGQALLDAAVGDRPCSLWVAEDNPRAQAFYARNGFRPDGARTVEPTWDDLAEIRLVR